MMTPEQWRQVKELLADALELDARSREVFVEAVRERDPGAGQELKRLLAGDKSSGGFFEATDCDRVFAALTAPIPGQRIGPYEILREIGRGGMGTVYLAEHAGGGDRKQVAIKIVHAQPGMSEVAGRFRRERQLLAALRHPNIAPLLDGGTTADGRTYLVMEHLRGETINIWCESHQPDARERVRLILKICGAVAYAHEHHVIHRDIKPGNILVAEDGVPWLLDFGIAKVLRPGPGAETAVSAPGHAPMTPEYASPEQIRGGPVGPASDIYSLVVVLRELLRACDGIPGDLEAVLRKATAYEPGERYSSVAEFSRDLERFLKNLPVRALTASAYYRAGKFLKRHRGAALTASAACALALLWGSPGKPLRSPSAHIAELHFTFERIAGLGDPAPGGGSFVSDFEPYGSNGRGDLAFAADLSTGGEGEFLLPKGRHPILIARQGQNAPGGGFLEGSTQGHTALNGSGQVAFVFGVKPFSRPALGAFVNAGLYRYLPGEGILQPVVIPGITAAPRFGVFQSTGQHASINSVGDIVFPGVVRTAAGESADGIGQGIFLADRRGRIRVVVAPGDPAPGGGVFDFAGNPWINDRGDIVFGAHVSGEECIPSPPGCMESIYRKDAATGKIESIAHQDGQAPGGHFYRGAWGPALNNRGDIVFMGELTPPPGLPSARGVFLYSKGVVVAIARPGDVMPGGRELLTVNAVSSAGNYSLNDRGDVTFNARLRGGISGLYLYSRGALHQVVESGTVIPGVGAVATVSGLVGGVLNEAAQVFFWAALTDGRGVLLLASPSTRSGG